MGFQKGNKLATGRPKGTKNKNTLMVEMIAQKFPMHPFEILMHFAQGNWKELGYDSEVYVMENAMGSTKIGYTISPEMRLTATKEAIKYLISPKKEEAEAPTDEIEVMSLEQKKEFIEKAQKEIEALKEEIKTPEEVKELDRED